jgi:RHS repeat-associated protein
VHQSSTNNLLKANSITYDPTSGNITNKSDLGDFTMNYAEKKADGTNNGPHALTSIAAVPANFPTADLNVTYTDFKKIASLTEASKSYSITYGVDRQRRTSTYTNNGTTLTRYYLGDYEEEIVGNNVRKIHYLSGGNGLAAIFVQNNGKDSLMYAYTDNQGSLAALTDESGNVIERYAYDPWGARRNPDDWTQKDSRSKWITNRGYTLHEHLDAFGIINMNGRVYDPLTAMFMSPDPFVQSPDNWVNYNRYTYCFNNPLIFNDPSGYKSAMSAGDAIDYLYFNTSWGGTWSNEDGFGNGDASSFSSNEEADSYVGYYIDYHQYWGGTRFANKDAYKINYINPHYISRDWSLELVGFPAGDNQWNFFQLNPKTGTFYIPYTNIEVNPLSVTNGNNGGETGIRLPDSNEEIVTSIAAITSIYKKIPTIMNPIVSTHYSEVNFKGGKFMGKIGIAGNLVNSYISVVNIINNPSNVVNYSDALFTGIGWVPVYGDFGALLYMGAKNQINIRNENILNNRDVNSGVYVPATGDVWIYN